MFIRRKTHERMLLNQQRSFEKEREAHRSQITDLLDRIMYLADRPWTPPPMPEPEPQPEVEWPSLPEQLTPDEIVELT